MPITKIVDYSSGKPKSELPASKPRSNSGQFASQAEQQASLIKLKPTGLLQEHLRRDLEGVYITNPTQAHPSEIPRANTVSNAIQQLRKKSISEGSSDAPNFVTGIRRNSFLAQQQQQQQQQSTAQNYSVNGSENGRRPSVKTRSRANSDLTKAAAPQFQIVGPQMAKGGGGALPRVPSASEPVATNYSTVPENHQVSNDYSIRKSKTTVNEMKREATGEAPQNRPDTIVKSNSYSGLQEALVEGTAGEVTEKVLPRNPSLRTITLERQKSIREKAEFSEVFARIKSGGSQSNLHAASPKFVKKEGPTSISSSPQALKKSGSNLATAVPIVNPSLEDKNATSSQMMTKKSSEKLAAQLQEGARPIGQVKSLKSDDSLNDLESELKPQTPSKQQSPAVVEKELPPPKRPQQLPSSNDSSKRSSIVDPLNKSSKSALEKSLPTAPGDKQTQSPDKQGSKTPVTSLENQGSKTQVQNGASLDRQNGNSQAQSNTTPGTPTMTRFSAEKVESFKYEQVRGSTYDVDSFLELKEVLQSHLSLRTSDVDLSKKTQKIVQATASCPNPADGELRYLEGDVLLVTDPNVRPGWVVAKHESTGKKGLVKSDNIREMDSFFAEIVSLADNPSPVSPNRKETRSDSVNSADIPSFNSAPTTGGSKRPNLRELSKNSKFNLSFESDLSVNGRSTAKRIRTPTMEESWSKRVGEEVSGIIDREEKKRQEAIYEYIETEKGFLDDMEMVLDGYYRPMREGRILSESDALDLFSNLQQIVQITQESTQVLSALQAESNGVIDQIGDILIRELPKLRDYAPFCSNLSRAVHFINEKKKSSQQFSEKLAEFAKNPYFRNMDLNSFMLKPMQRITKIPLLIKGILKHTSKDTRDFKLLSEAESLSQEILLYINSKCGEADEFRKLEKIQKKLNFDLMQECGLDFFDERKRKIVFGGALECNDKKISAYLFEDIFVIISTKLTNKIERFTLHKPMMSLWLIDITTGEASAASNSSTQNSATSKPLLKSQSSRLMMNAMRSVKEPAKSFSVYDPQADSTYDFCASNAREKEQWVNTLMNEQKRLLETSKFTLDRFKGLPIHLSKDLKTKKPINYEYTCGVRLGRYYLVGHTDGLLAGTEESGYEFLECPGFVNSSICQMYVDENIRYLVIVEGKTYSVEAYPVDSIMLLLNFMFDMTKDITASPPGMKVTKLPSSKNTKALGSGFVNEVPHIATSSEKSISLFQYNPTGKMFKKINEFHVADASNCNCVTFMRDSICLGIGNRFMLLDLNDRRMEEINDGTLSDQLQNSQAIACVIVSERSLLLCYDSIGVLVDTTSRPFKTEKYFLWKLSATKFGLHMPYVVVYSKNFVEYWNIKKGTMRQIIHTPGQKVLDHTTMMVTVSEPDNMNTLSLLKLFQQHEQKE